MFGVNEADLAFVGIDLESQFAEGWHESLDVSENGERVTCECAIVEVPYLEIHWYIWFILG